MLLLGEESSFITKKEYGELLYQNPRGIGCNVCHGNRGEGKIIATYKDKRGNHKIKAPKINNIDYEKYLKMFKRKSTGLMPKYFLTNEELQVIYFYITDQNRQKDSE